MTRLRGNAWQADFTFRKSRYRKTFDSKIEAETWEHDAKAKLLRGEAVDDGKSAPAGTLKDLMNRTYDRYWKDSKADSKTLANAVLVVNILGPNRPPGSIGTSQIESVIDELKRRNMANGTINRKLAALSKILHHGVEREVIKHVPRIPRLKEGEGRIRWLTEAEEKTLLDRLTFLGRTDLQDLIILLIDVGPRLSELLGDADKKYKAPLHWKDVDLDAPAIRFWETKNGKARSIPLTDRALGILLRRRKDCPLGEEIVFWNFEYWMAQHQWQHVRTSLGMEHDEQYVLHMLRHTFCSRLVQKGTPIQVVQQLAGHKTLAVTLRYAHLHQANLVEAIRGPQRKAGDRTGSKFPPSSEAGAA